MTFIHEDSDFSDLVLQVAADGPLRSAGLVEKDYWVSHTLWALHQTGLEVWFKGGTSLSKGFALTQRFSEDLDCKVEPGSVAGLPTVGSSKKKRNPKRRALFERLESVILVPGATVKLDRSALAQDDRDGHFQIHYSGSHLGSLDPTLKPFVVLEVGDARVTPFVSRQVRSQVQDWLEAKGKMAGFRNGTVVVRCVHPFVTLLEKLDAVAKRYARDPLEPETFVRHYEDAAHIIRAGDRLPTLGMDLAQLIKDMREGGQLKVPLAAEDPAFTLADAKRRAAIDRANTEIAPLFWGPRIPIDECCADIRAWLKAVRPDTY